MRLLILFVIVLGGSILLQSWLCRSRAVWPGLVIPSVFAIIAGFYALNATSIAAAVLIFVICNIPTAVHLTIYFVTRKRQAKASELDKMQAQDLE